MRRSFWPASTIGWWASGLGIATAVWGGLLLLLPQWLMAIAMDSVGDGPMLGPRGGPA